jgi:hypothetical protein
MAREFDIEAYEHSVFNFTQADVHFDPHKYDFDPNFILPEDRAYEQYKADAKALDDTSRAIANVMISVLGPNIFK